MNLLTKANQPLAESVYAGTFRWALALGIARRDARRAARQVMTYALELKEGLR